MIASISARNRSRRVVFPFCCHANPANVCCFATLASIESACTPKPEPTGRPCGPRCDAAADGTAARLELLRRAMLGGHLTCRELWALTRSRRALLLLAFISLVLDRKGTLASAHLLHTPRSC